MKQCNDFTLKEWLHYLENRHQQEIQLGLTRVSQVAEKLELLHSAATVITVGGTNGKGSTVASLEAIYLAAGYRVASYTSPHLLVFNERIRLNKKNIDDDSLCKAFCFIEAGRGEVELSYFEMTTLAALWYFKQQSLDLIILEVGLGGRLDATNIIDSDLAIITTIDYDHQEFLGNTKEAIAYEKAGIIRPGMPVIYSDVNITQSILDKVKEVGASLYSRDCDYSYQLLDHSLKLQFGSISMELPRPRLHANSVTAALIASILLQHKLPVEHQQLERVLLNLDLSGRQQLLKNKYNSIFDVSHNPQAVAYLAEYLSSLQLEGKVYAVFAALKDKDIVGMIAPLVKLVDQWHISVLNVKRSASEIQLQAACSEYSIIPLFYNSPVLAYQSACKEAKTGDLIITYGSFITVGEVLISISIPEKLTLS